MAQLPRIDKQLTVKTGYHDSGETVKFEYHLIALLAIRGSGNEQYSLMLLGPDIKTIGSNYDYAGRTSVQVVSGDRYIVTLPTGGWYQYLFLNP